VSSGQVYISSALRPGFFLDRDQIESRLDRMLSGELPGSADFLRTNIEAFIDLRGAA